MIYWGGSEAICRVLIELRCARMVRSEIEVRHATLLDAPPEGSA